MNVLVNLTYEQVRAIENARYILAAQEAMGQDYRGVVEDLGEILGLARRERLHSVRADLLEPQPKDDGYHDQMADVYDLRADR